MTMDAARTDGRAWAAEATREVGPRRGHPATSRAKRAVDVLVSSAGLLVLSPVLGAIALVVRATSPGPALYGQERIGLGGRPFVMYKFRTMRDGASADRHKEYVARLIAEGASDEMRASGGAYKLEGDDRVTGAGRWLRKTSLDELPQLLNVLKGDMSLVGPRPPLPYEVDLYEPRHRRRLEAPPGITGLWQVSGRTRTTFEEMVELDVAYVEGWSLWLDARIGARTVPALFDTGGAL